MLNAGAPEYYPAATNIQYTNEYMSYVYYSHGYNPYNPFNPFIPGAMEGVDGSLGGQKYYALPNYQNHVSSFAYIPIFVPPYNSPDSSVDSLYGNSASVSRPDGRGLKKKFNSASGNFSRNSSKPLSNQTSSLAKVPEGPRVNDGRKQDLIHASVSGSSFPNIPSSTVNQIEGADLNSHFTSPNLGQTEVMLNEGVPEFVVDQNLYYPATINYGYYCTGFESPVEWEDHHRILRDCLTFHLLSPMTEILWTVESDKSIKLALSDPSAENKINFFVEITRIARYDLRGEITAIKVFYKG